MLSWLKMLLYRLADRLLLLKWYDNKMVKLLGCSSVGASSCSKQQQQKQKNVVDFTFPHFLFKPVNRSFEFRPIGQCNTATWFEGGPLSLKSLLFYFSNSS